MLLLSFSWLFFLFFYVIQYSIFSTKALCALLHCICINECTYEYGGSNNHSYDPLFSVLCTIWWLICLSSGWSVTRNVWDEFLSIEDSVSKFLIFDIIHIGKRDSRDSCRLVIGSCCELCQDKISTRIFKHFSYQTMSLK